MVGHGACGVLNRPFIAGKFSLRAPTQVHQCLNTVIAVPEHWNNQEQKKWKREFSRQGGDIAGGGEVVCGLRAPAQTSFLLLKVFPRDCQLNTTQGVKSFSHICRDWIDQVSFPKPESLWQRGQFSASMFLLFLLQKTDLSG